MFFVFFFKQKTAYEMRISDWSSDVCSSDLDVRMPEILAPARIGSVRDVQNLAVRLILRRRGVDFEWAEAPRKGDMLFGRDELVAKEDDLVREQRGADFGDGRVILFAGEVEERKSTSLNSSH